MRTTTKATALAKRRAAAKSGAAGRTQRRAIETASHAMRVSDTVVACLSGAEVLWAEFPEGSDCVVHRAPVVAWRISGIGTAFPVTVEVISGADTVTRHANGSVVDNVTYRMFADEAAWLAYLKTVPGIGAAAVDAEE